MAKETGRLCLIKKNGTTIGGLLTNSMTVNGTPVNVEDKGDAGVQTMLSGILTGQSIEISGEGYEEDNVLRDIALGPASGKFLSDITYVFGDGDVISGNFVMTAYSESAEKDEAEKFNATFVSDGAWTFTPAV